MPYSTVEALDTPLEEATHTPHVSDIRDGYMHGPDKSSNTTDLAEVQRRRAEFNRWLANYIPPGRVG